MRHYNKLSKFMGAFGYGWTSLFDVSITQQGLSQLRMLRDDGSTVYFEPDGSVDPNTGNGSYHSGIPHNFYGTLVKSGFGYTVTQRNGWVYEFNALGALTAIADRNNSRVTLIRNTFNNVSAISDGFGRSFTVSYGNHVEAIRFGSETVATYHYAGFNNTQVIYADGSQYQHQYNERGLSIVRDALNNVLTKWTFNDLSGALVSVERANGVEKLTYDYLRTASSGALMPVSRLTARTLANAWRRAMTHWNG